MSVVPAMPSAANANPMRVAAGSAASAHQECTRPNAAMTIRKATAYNAPRMSAQQVSPTAMSPAPTGVASMASYVLAYLSLKNMLNVVSKMAPFIADAARSAGAMNAV